MSRADLNRVLDELQIIELAERSQMHQRNDGEPAKWTAVTIAGLILGFALFTWNVDENSTASLLWRIGACLTMAATSVLLFLQWKDHQKYGPLWDQVMHHPFYHVGASAIH